ncbi:MAG: hypothetical protein GTO02_03485 [Candidatus Dadabacteria bacterium]|nr:hypothetical protein [Candidatus Dadabacteria bacterium]
MKNYWLDKKKSEKRWKRFEIKSYGCCSFIIKDEEWYGPCEDSEPYKIMWEKTLEPFDFNRVQ